MTNLYHIPIEPLSERYSEQWYRKFPEALTSAGFNVITIDGQPLLQNEISVGTFLDINSTCAYKWTQLQQIAQLFHNKQVPDGSVFFFADIEFWGLEGVRLLAQMNNVDVKLTGFLHAASYTMEDAFAVAADYQRYTEVGWIAALDEVYVGSAYHKQAVTSRRLNFVGAHHLRNRIKVTKNPIFLDEYPVFVVPKKKKVLLTNRFDREKRPAETLALFQTLKKLFPGWEFVVTTGRPSLRGHPDDVAYAKHLESSGVIQIKTGLTKEEYHRELAESFMVVSHSIEENYGYCVAESLIYGCYPLLRAGLSHEEFVPDDRFLFDNDSGLAADSDLQKAVDLIQLQWGTPSPLSLDTSGMENILKELSKYKR